MLCSFLGLASYYLKSVPHFSTVDEPLRKLLKEEVAFVLGEEQQPAFNKVKALIQGRVLLAIFYSSLPAIVTTDASDYGLGPLCNENILKGLRLFLLCQGY